jgi:hypothetical protein
MKANRKELFSLLIVSTILCYAESPAILKEQPRLGLIISQEQIGSDQWFNCKNSDVRLPIIDASYSNIEYLLILSPKGEVEAIVTNDEHFKTPEGLKIGDPLSMLRKKYPQLLVANSDGSFSLTLPSGWCAKLPNPITSKGCFPKNLNDEPSISEFSIKNKSFCGEICDWGA